MNYRNMLEQGFVETNASLGGQSTRLDYLGNFIFDFTTYDSDMSELFATKALEVCAAISDKATFEYIKDPEQYRWYLVMCNMPFFVGRLDWGTSIRGAWWTGSVTLDTYALWLDGNPLPPSMELTSEQWHEFVAAMIEFAKEQQ